MGRSKFPGKPSKHVNRQRVNVLSRPQNTPKLVIAENICIGLPSNSTICQNKVIIYYISNNN